LYPAQGASSVRPHAPHTICGSLVTYDANGNTISYDVDGTAGPKPARSFTYDLENRCTGVLKWKKRLGRGRSTAISFRTTLSKYKPLLAGE
jgi:hypothetical protein